MERLSIHLLGPFQVTLDGQPRTEFGYDHVRALLAYLTVEADRPHRRERLAGLLWPEQPHSRALSNLRYALYNLRKAIHDRDAQPPFLLVSRQTLQFNGVSDHWVDVTAFAQHMAQSRQADGGRLERSGLGWSAGEHPPIRHLEAAAQLYHGRFLEGFSLPHSPAFEEWVVLEQEHLAQQLLAGLHRLIQICLARGDFERGERHARRLLALEPWDEEAHRQLMRLLTFGGRRSAALAHYQTYRSVLGEDLGVEPAARTAALYEQIREGLLSKDDVLRAASRLSAPAIQSRPTPTRFVGREPELAQLDALLDRALSGHGRVAFVSGGAGSGKTTLLAEFVRRAMARFPELVVVRGRCSARSGYGDPFLPFREMLQMLAGDIEAQRASGAIAPEHARRLWTVFPDAVRALVTEGPDLIGRFVPADPLVMRAQAFVPPAAVCRSRLEALLRHRESGAESHDAAQPDLFAQATRVLEAVADTHPLILVLDDLQWADAGSASMLFHLGRRLAGHRILILAAHRPADLASGAEGKRHPIEPVVNEIQRDYGDARIDLDRADGQRFLDALLDSEPNELGAAFREMLYRHTAGNPLFTVELLRGLQERGDIVKDPSDRWVADLNLDWRRLPARVEGAIAERIAQLGPELRDDLKVASVQGETFAAEVLAHVRGADEGRIIRRLSSRLSKQHRLVTADSVRRVDGQRLSGYRFRHVLFQTYLYEGLDAVERARLHEAVGTALEKLYGRQAESISAELARHFEAAGMVPKAIDYLLKAGKQAVRLSANKDAIALFTRGLELLETLPHTPDRDRKEVTLRQACYAPLTSTRGYARRELARSHVRAHELSLRLGQERDLITTLICQAGLHSFRAEFERATDLAGRGLVLAERAEAPGHVVWATQVLGMTALSQGRLLVARDQLERTLTIDNPEHDAMLTVRGRDPRVVYRAFAAWAEWLMGRPDQALRLGQEALRLAEAADHPPTLAMALLVANVIPRTLLRDYDAIPAYAEAYARLAAQHKLELSSGGIRLASGRARVYRGQAKAGIEEMQHGLAAWQATKTRAWRSLYLALLADAWLETGELVEAEATLDTAFAFVQETGERLVEAELHRLRGAVLLAGGKHEGAEACFRQAIEVARDQEARSWERRARTSLARLLADRGDEEAARWILTKSYAWFADGLDTPDLLDARALLDELAHR